MPVKNPGLKSAASSTVEDYLERILELINSKGYARVVDIAAALEISQASVTNMVQRLDAERLLKYEKYRGLVLTEAGEKLARRIAHRHRLLTEFLKLLGLDDRVICHDVEGSCAGARRFARNWKPRSCKSQTSTVTRLTTTPGRQRIVSAIGRQQTVQSSMMDCSA